VDNSKWLVKFGRAKWKAMEPQVVKAVRFGRAQVPTIIRGGHEFAKVVGNGGRVLGHQGRKIVWFFEWRRVPKEWELSFVAKMRSMEAQGITFQKVLRTNLPALVGEGPSEVLQRWVGKRARAQPKRFVNVVRKMFGKSAKRIITGLERLADPDKLIEAQNDVEPPFQSLIEAIQRADDEKAQLAQEIAVGQEE